MTHPNLRMLAEAARALRPALGDEVVFVGGATIGLLLPAARARSIRMTVDVDVVVPARRHAEFACIEAALRKAGFSHGTEPGDPICRWRNGHLIVDVMPLDPAPLGFANRFYEGATPARPNIICPEARSSA